MKSRKLKVLLNAAPLTRIGAGIGRYLRCLYGAMLSEFGDCVEVGFFDGRTVSAHMPQGPTDAAAFSRLSNLFWRLPWPAALGVRLAVQAGMERRFSRSIEGWDVYHEAGFFPFNAAKRIPTVFTIHDCSLQRFPQHHPRERVAFARLFLRSRLALSERVLTVSEFGKVEVLTMLQVSPQAIDVTPLAHDEGVFYPRTPDEIESARLRFGLPERYFLFVGSGDPRKNFDIIPTALDQAGLSIPVAAAGWSGWDDRQSKDERILRLNYVDDESLAALYGGAVALVMPSLYEGFGLPIVEAFACGCPVIAADRASLPEVCGDAALLLQDPRDVGEAAAALAEVAGDDALRTDMALKGLERATGFSWRKTAEATLSALEKTARV